MDGGPVCEQVTVGQRTVNRVTERSYPSQTEAPVTRRGAPGELKSVVMFTPHTLTFFFENKKQLLLISIVLFSFHFLIVNCEIFIYKYINHISPF